VAAVDVVLLKLVLHAHRVPVWTGTWTWISTSINAIQARRTRGSLTRDLHCQSDS
jgi:hypothetical protein